MAIRTIFWDLGNVLVYYVPRREKLWRLAQLFCPLRFPQNVRKSASQQTNFYSDLARAGVLDLSRPDEDSGWKLDIGQVSRQKLYGGFIRATGCNSSGVPPERFWAMYNADQKVVPHICSFVIQTQASGIKAIAATNGETFAASDLLALNAGITWDDVVMSWQVGVRKPDPRFFAIGKERAENILGQHVDWTECLLIDDQPANVDGFAHLGGNAILFEANSHAERESARRLQGQLARYGIEICTD